MTQRALRWLRLGTLAIGLTLLAALIARVGPLVLVGQLRALGSTWISVAFLSLGWMLGNAWAWGLAAGFPRPPLAHLLRAHLAGEALNNLAPLSVAGEPLRVALLAGTTGWPRALASGLADGIVHLGSAALYLLLACVALLALRLPAALALGFALATLALLVGSGLLWGLAASGAPSAWAHRIAARWPGLAEAPSGGREFLRSPSALASLLVHLAGRLLGAVEAWLILDALGFPLSPAGALVLIGGMHVLGNLAFAFVPAQLGVQEGLAWLLLGALGLDPASAVALSLARRVRGLAWTGVGLLLVGRLPQR